MNFDSPLAPFIAIKEAKKYFENEVTNAVIKKAPLTRGDDQILEAGISGGRWEVFWMRIQAIKSENGSRIYVKSRPGTTQLTMGTIAVLLAVPFAYLVLNNNSYWLLFIPIFFFILGVLSIIMPIVRARTTRKEIYEKLTAEKKKR